MTTEYGLILAAAICEKEAHSLSFPDSELALLTDQDKLIVAQKSQVLLALAEIFRTRALQERDVLAHQSIKD